jgi:F0F1-type ATP synthase assembly protein I
MIATHKIQRKQYQTFNGILLMSAWSFAMVTASFLFLWIGYKLDEFLGTGPHFMIGLFTLAVFLCLTRIYAEAKRRMKDL